MYYIHVYNTVKISNLTYLNLRHKNNTLHSGKAGHEKNLYPGGLKKKFFCQLNWIFEIKFTLEKLL